MKAKSSIGRDGLRGIRGRERMGAITGIDRLVLHTTMSNALQCCFGLLKLVVSAVPSCKCSEGGSCRWVALRQPVCCHQEDYCVG
jgi:hypothetical protein